MTLKIGQRPGVVRSALRACVAAGLLLCAACATQPAPPPATGLYAKRPAAPPRVDPDPFLRELRPAR